LFWDFYMIATPIYIQFLLQQMEASYLGIDTIRHKVDSLWDFNNVKAQQGFSKTGQYAYIVRDVEFNNENKECLFHIYLFDVGILRKFKYFHLRDVMTWDVSRIHSTLSSVYAHFITSYWEKNVYEKPHLIKKVNYVSTT
jgi:hypothetical protein